MDIIVKKQINLYIELLSKISLDYEYESWIPNCIECLQFALDNEQLLKEKPELYQDTLSTICLLYSWIVEERGWAYIELREKFKTWYMSEEAGKSLRHMLEIFNKQDENEESIDRELIDTTENILQKYNKTIYTGSGEYKPIIEILDMLSEIWEKEGECHI